jgi:hypothetical protein
MADDHRCLRHESLGDTCNRELFFPEILLPKVGEHFTSLGPSKFNGRSLAADINYAEMMVPFNRTGESFLSASWILQ